MRVSEAESHRQFDVAVEFVERGSGDPKEPGVIRRGRPTSSLGDVGHNPRGGSASLTDETEAFVLGETRGVAIHRQCEQVSPAPYLEAVIVTHSVLCHTQRPGSILSFLADD